MSSKNKNRAHSSSLSKVLLIIPCYNEEKRLNKEEFLKYACPNLQFLFADDGSTDGTAQVLKGLSKESPYCHIYFGEKNRGKGGVIRDAMIRVQQIFDKDQMKDQMFDWVGYWDADLATPLWEVENMINYVDSEIQNIQSIWGSRIQKLGSSIQRSALRHILGRGFATLIELALNLKAYDTQCGAKLFRPFLAEMIFKEPLLSRWIFDVELLLRIINHFKVDKSEELGIPTMDSRKSNFVFPVIEYPLKQWRDIPGSKMKIGKEIGRVLRDVYLIRRKYKGTIGFIIF